MTFLYSEVHTRYASDSHPAKSFAWSCTLGIEHRVYINLKSLAATGSLAQVISCGDTPWNSEDWTDGKIRIELKKSFSIITKYLKSFD